MRQRIWLSFDLGVRGDYEGMYVFLDSHEAKECGDSVGTFVFQYDRDIVKELTKNLKQAVQIDKRSRIYVVYTDADGKSSGKFLVGGRKAPPWAGHAPSDEDGIDADE